jgi:hypothetical protein
MSTYKSYMKKPFNGDRAKDGKILEMYYHGYTYDQIAKEFHVAPNHIASVIRAERTRVDKEKRDKQSARALQLFSKGKSPIDVCMKLAISADETFRMHGDYLELTYRQKLVEMHEELGMNNLTNIVDLYETMKNAGIPIKNIVKLCKDYLIIPFVRDELENLIDDVRRHEDKLEQYISNWQELKNRNMDLKRENRYLKEENRDLEKKNRDLEINNRDLEKKNTTTKYPQLAALRLPAYTEPDSSNKTYDDQELPYLSSDPPSTVPTKSGTSLTIDGGSDSPVSSCNNLAENETKSIDPVKELTPSNTKSPDTTVSSAIQNSIRKEPRDIPNT